MFKRVQGKTKFMWYPVTTSTAFSKGDLVAMNVGSNLLIEATSTTAGNIILGLFATLSHQQTQTMQLLAK